MSNEKKIKINLFQSEGRIDNRAINAGIYIVELLKEAYPLGSAMPLYIGESVYMLKRCGEHLYDFFEDSRYFGLKDDDLQDEKFSLCFSALKYLPSSVGREERKQIEKEYIVKYKPLTQNPNSDRQIRSIEDKVTTVQNALEKWWGNKDT